MISRRKFLIQSGLGLASTSVFLSSCQLARNNELGILIGPRRLLVSGPENKELGYIGIENLFTGETVNIRAGAPGHSVIQHPIDPMRFVMLAQRPGTISTDLHFRKNGKHVVRPFKSTKDRHFYGHGLFTPDGKTLITTENNFSDAKGQLVLRDATTLKVQKEFESYGVGPHDIRFVDNGRTIVIANGGKKTSPKYKDGYLAYNLGNFESSITWVILGILNQV